MNGTMDDTAGTETQTTRDPNAICTLLGHESNKELLLKTGKLDISI
jgi:hypothetical protein